MLTVQALCKWVSGYNYQIYLKIKSNKYKNPSVLYNFLMGLPSKIEVHEKEEDEVIIHFSLEQSAAFLKCLNKSPLTRLFLGGTR